MKVSEKIFRDMYRQVCLLENPALAEKINPRAVFDYPPDEKLDGFVVYGYIDEEAGFSFKILAGAQISDNRLKIFPASYKKNFVLRRAEVDDAEIKFLAEDYAVAFRDKIQVINDNFATNPAKEQTRFVKTIDSLRHPNYPDDVLVLFHGENFQPEQAWVRCVAVEENLITGVLLNELRQNFGFTVGDKIVFGVTEIDGEIFCVIVK